MNTKFLVPASIVLAGIIIAVAVIYATGDQSLEPANNSQPTNFSAPTIDDDVILGQADAPVTLIEFGDYECPFCKKMFDESEPQIRKEYIETGKVRMVYRDFPLSFHPSAMPAAEASECAKEQGKFWLYHDALFNRQAQLATLNYVTLATELGLNAAEFKTCVETHKYKSEIEKDYQDGVAAGVDGTPATFVNGKLVSGAQPYAVFKAEIEAALKK